jgi:hypothetical protein
MPAVHFNGLAYRDFAALLEGVPLGAISKATRSTVPLLDFWRGAIRVDARATPAHARSNATVVDVGDCVSGRTHGFFRGID